MDGRPDFLSLAVFIPTNSSCTQRSVGPLCVLRTGDLVTNWHLFSIFEPGKKSLAMQQGEGHQDSELSVFSAESRSASMMSAERRQSGGQKPWALASLHHQLSHERSEGAGLGQGGRHHRRRCWLVTVALGSSWSPCEPGHPRGVSSRSETQLPRLLVVPTCGVLADLPWFPIQAW